MSPGWLALGLLLVACPKRGPALDDTPRYALLRPDAPLHTEPKQPPLRPYRDAARAAEQAAEGYEWSRWRVLREDGDWVRLQSVAAHDPSFCRPPFAPLRGLEVGVWVRREHLGLVTSAPSAHHDDDGVGWALSPGLPVVADGVGRPLVRLDGLDLRLPVLPPAVGTTFQHAPALTLDAASPLAASTGRVVPIGDATLHLFAGSGALAVDGPDDHGRYRYSTHCAHLVTPEPHPPTRDTAALVGLSESGRGLGVFVAEPTPRAGAPLYWPNGRRAGQVIDERPLGAEVSPTGGRRCFALDLVSWRPSDEEPRADQHLTLCVDPDDVYDDD